MFLIKDHESMDLEELGDYIQYLLDRVFQGDLTETKAYLDYTGKVLDYYETRLIEEIS